MTMANADPANESIDWTKVATQARKRLVWKEGRLLLPACLGVILLAVIAMVAVGVFPAHSLTDNAGQFIALALAGATMAALVCGCMAFAPERETGTDAFLARLPVNGGQLARTKIFTATVYFFVSYFVSLACATGLFAVFFHGQNLLWLCGSKGVLGAMVPIAFLMPAVVFLWSLAFSRYLSSTLSAVVSAGCCAVCALAFFMLLIELSVSFLDRPQQWVPVIVVAMFAVKIIALLSVIAYQHGTWLRPSVIVSDRLATKTMSKSKSIATSAPNGGFMRSMRSLLWQTFRLHWGGALVAVLVCGLYLIAILISYNTVAMASGIEWACFGVEYLNDLFAAAVGAATGIFLFARDQRGRSYQFFQQRADYPRRIWLARITSLVAIGAVVVLVIGVVNQVSYSTAISQFQMFRMGRVLEGFSNPDFWFGGDYRHGYSRNADYSVHTHSLGYFYSLTFRAATMFFVVAAVGQLVSIFCRHGILNALLGVVFCFLTAFWIRYVNWYQVPTWAYAWPIGIAAFSLSWAYAPSWIRGTRQLKWSIVAVVVMLVVAVGSVVCLRADRLNDYHQHAFFTDLEELYFNPEKLKANGDPRFEVTRKIEAAIAPINLKWADTPGLESSEGPNMPEFSDAELKLVDEFPESFAKITSLVLDPAVRHYLAQSPDASQKITERKAGGLFRVLHLYAAAKEKKGQNPFDALLARYALDTNLNVYSRLAHAADMLDWAESGDRSTADLKLAITKIDSLRNTQTVNDEFRIENAYSAVLGKYNEYLNGMSSTRGDFSWEIERSKRRFANDLLVDLNISNPNFFSPNANLESLSARQLTKSNWKLLAPMRAAYADLNDAGYQFDQQYNFYKQRQLQYLKVRFALAAWKLDNGSYPKKLSQLSGEYVAEAEFLKMAYYPDGLDKPTAFSSDYNAYRNANGFVTLKTKSVIPAKTPFLMPWQAAPMETRLFAIKTMNEDDTEVIDVSDPEDGYLMVDSAERLVSSGYISFAFGRNVEKFILSQ